MRIQLGSEDIVFDWVCVKRKMPKKVKVQIAELLSLGITDGHFHHSFDGVKDELGWWVCLDKVSYPHLYDEDTCIKL